MCLGVPGEIVSLANGEAVVDCWGARRTVRLDELTEPVAVGDFIIEHGGSAVRVIPPQDVMDTLALYEVLLTEGGEDPIVREVSLALA